MLSAALTRVPGKPTDKIKESDNIRLITFFIKAPPFIFVNRKIKYYKSYANYITILIVLQQKYAPNTTDNKIN